MINVTIVTMINMTMINMSMINMTMINMAKTYVTVTNLGAPAAISSSASGGGRH